ncbi:nuclear transport factor 2 family protein [Kutzneria buriramensis]|uniref:SnoaL-like protein n=1 Tax=Kutzneria buriramensis TaxID=1045776 RepID=A0A3E0HPA5_9PSEU|nr:nuclear transport factor 2 family protein [Kutzneria buriramensis]REH48268.1 SnoaL-like protein [Kutzneria buriramensis]
MSNSQVVDRLLITETVTRMGRHIDRADWPALAEVLAPEIALDYSSLYGGAPHRVSRDELVGRMTRFVAALDMVQHLILGVLATVDGDKAIAAANVVAVHRKATHLGNPLWTVAGTYDFGLVRTGDGWQIDALRLTVLWADGNQHLRPAPPSS